MKDLYNRILRGIEDWCRNRRIKIEAKDWKKSGEVLKDVETHQATLRIEQVIMPLEKP